VAPHASGARQYVTVEHVEPSEGTTDLRAVLSALGARLAENGAGLIVTIDELQSGDIDEIHEFGAVLQHVTRREQQPVAFAGASLPSIDDTLLSDDDIATFLQRCSRYDIDHIGDSDAALAIAEPIIARNGAIDDQDLARALDRIVTRRVLTAGLANASSFSPHSLRAGFITEAKNRGIDEADIMKRARLKSLRIMRSYDR